MRRLLVNRWFATAVVAALIVGIGFELNALAADRGLPDAPAASRDTARKFALAITTFDYKRIDADRQRVLDLGSATFGRELRAELGTDFIEGVKANKRVSTGQVIEGPTVLRVTGGRAAFVVVVAQRISSEGTNVAPQSRTEVMLLTVSTGKTPRVEHVDVVYDA